MYACYIYTLINGLWLDFTENKKMKTKYCNISQYSEKKFAIYRNTFFLYRVTPLLELICMGSVDLRSAWKAKKYNNKKNIAYSNRLSLPGLMTVLLFNLMFYFFAFHALADRLNPHKGNQTGHLSDVIGARRKRSFKRKMAAVLVPCTLLRK